MKIKILAFGIAKEILGGNSIEIDFETIEMNVKLLKEKLVEQFPDLAQLKHFSVAVNENYVTDDFVISQMDEVVILPPVSGG